MLINADIGECGIKVDSIIMPNISMASIACGGHVGDLTSVTTTVKLALAHNTCIGAHISYDDKVNFGRKSLNQPLIKLKNSLRKQLQLLNDVSKINNTAISYIKPHGALYHDAMKNFNIFTLIVELAKEFAINKIITQYGVTPAANINFAKNNNITLMFEVFADRGYDGVKLIKRGKKNAVFNTQEQIKKQYNDFITANDADTICFHSDNKASVTFLRNLKYAM